MSIDLNELKELLSAIAQNNIAELTLKSDDFELNVRKGIPTVNGLGDLPKEQTSVTVPTPVTVTETVTASPTTSDKKWIDITSPIVGTFYRSPSPEDPPFAQVGDSIRSGQTVCIIEAMKVMNEIEAEVSGQVMEILVQNAQTVEYGQPLMRVLPAQS
jgi:acetyl-CoA carboxylase biotin carboxyl carrier protein